MYAFGGGGKSKIKPQYTGLAVQTSTSAIAIAIGLGLNRGAPNVIYQTDFQAHKQTQKTGKGGGSQTTGYTYSGTFILSLGFGPCSGCRRVWKDQSKETDFTKLGFTLISGTIPQSPWGYLTTNHPTEALGYPGLALMVVANYDLGQTNTLNQHSFEMEWPLLDTAPGGVGDADPAQCVDYLLNSTIYGALGGNTMALDNLFSTGAAPTPGDAAWQTYCRAMGFGMSPLLDSQEPCLQILDRWTRIFNTDLCWTGYSLYFDPLGPDSVTGNGVTYLPDNTLEFDLGDDDFLRADGDDPVILRRSRQSDAAGFYPLEIRNRSNEYNVQPAGQPDQGLVDQYGLRQQSAFKANEICEPAIGEVCAALFQQRQAYVRNQFEFELAPSFMYLLPGSKGSFTDVKFGTHTVRVVDIEETEEGTFHVIVEEWNGSVTSAPDSSPQDVTNNPVDTNVSAPAVNVPIIFEPPSTLAGASPQVWMAVSGGPAGTFDPNWGGCFVWLSSDNVTYQQVGQIDTAARMGVLATALASYGGANPDTAHSFDANLAMSDGELVGVTAADAAAFATLFVIKDAGGSLEFGSYRDASLVSGNRYTLGGQLYRGLYGTSAAAHSIGAGFARLDENIFKVDLPARFIGQTIYVKLQSFNIFGGGVEDLASCTAYSYSPAGTGFGGGTGGVPTTPATPGVTPATGYNVITWTANPTSDNIVRYDVYRATGSGQPFGSASKIGSTTGTSYTDSTAVAAQAYTYFVVAVNAIGPGSNSAGSNVTSGAAASQPYGFAFGPKAPVASKILAAFDTPIAWTLPSSLTNSQGRIVDSDTASAAAPSANTDFDIQSPLGSSIATMRFATGSLTATFINASSDPETIGATTYLVAPSNLNGITGAIIGSILGTR